MREEFRAEIENLKTQNVDLKNQIASLQASSSATTISIPEPQQIQEESIEKITEAVGVHLIDKFKKVYSQVNFLYKLVDDLHGSTNKVQKKLKSNAEVIERELQKIARFYDEDRHYEIAGIVKETDSLKGKIDVALDEF